MIIRFVKMQGLGNDFVVIDSTDQVIELNSDRVQALADRRTGIGFDQLLLIESAVDQSHDFVYRIFNANGQEVEQCGNGARCVAAYLFTKKLPQRQKLILATLAGNIEVQQQGSAICVNMGFPQLTPAAIPLQVPQQALQYQLNYLNHTLSFGAVSLGNPHAVLKVDDIVAAPVAAIGAWFQQQSSFPRQVNVGFMAIIAPDSIRLRVYERGVGETQACGSGAAAAVVIGRLCYQLAPKVTVALPGGNLTVIWSDFNAPIYLIGPATTVFTGEFIQK